MENKTESNRTHFDNEAANYDAKHEKATEEIVKRIEARRDFIGVHWAEDDTSEEEENGGSSAKPTRAVRFLDYACGTGSMTRAFAPYTTQCIGIDLSEKMVDVYNTRAQNQGLTEDDMVAYHGNICVPDDEDPERFRDAKFFDFDMACVGLGFHHFDDPGLAAKRLVTRLKRGGVLMIIDFLPHDPTTGHEHGHGHHHHHHHDGGEHGHTHGHDQDDEVSDYHHKALKTVTHHGFSEDSIKKIFVDAGAGQDFAIDRMGEVTMGVNMGKRNLFMARGTKI